jgi:tRNA(fMet)-specific endonuclease VapC
VVIGKFAFLASKKKLLLQNIRNLVQRGGIITVDEGTCACYRIIVAQLKQAGTSLPINDIWIAAQVLQHNLILATRDEHFKQVRGLKHEQW